MNYCVITAGGTGTRMGEKYRETPKQFIEVEGKPVLFYCVETANSNEDVDEIILVTLEDYIPYVWEKVKEFGLDKVTAVVPGGSSLKRSIYEGYKAARERGAKDDDVMVNIDGVRPLVYSSVISDVIKSAKDKGPTLSATPNKTGDYMVKDDMEVCEFFSKNMIFAGGTPAAQKFSDLEFAYTTAEGRGILDDERYGTCYISLLRTLGRKVYIVEDLELMNLKITTPHELYIFRALMKINKEEEANG